MTRGGYREGSGRKSSWNNPETRLIRVPKIFASQLLHIARQLDQGEAIDIVFAPDSADIEAVTESYGQDTLHQIAQEIIDNDAIVPAEGKRMVGQALNVFIRRLVQ